MKPRVGVYLSEGIAARLAEAAKHPRATKSGLVEAAPDRFLGSDDDIDDTATAAHHLPGLTRRLERPPRNLTIPPPPPPPPPPFPPTLPPPIPTRHLPPSS